MEELVDKPANLINREADVEICVYDRNARRSIFLA
jgi:hypothetical protein